MKLLSGGYKEIIALLLLLTGVAAFAASFVKPDIVDDFHLFYYFSLSSILAGSLYLFEKTRPWALSLSRLLVCSLFIVSGLIKCNDPMGFSFKLANLPPPSERMKTVSPLLKYSSGVERGSLSLQVARWSTLCWLRYSITTFSNSGAVIASMRVTFSFLNISRSRSLKRGTINFAIVQPPSLKKHIS